MTKNQLADEFEFESQMSREENPDAFDELEALREVDMERQLEEDY